MSKTPKKESSKSSTSNKELKFIISNLEEIQKRAQLQIVLKLLIYGELSMRELSNKTKKSKSTIHRNLEDLIRNGIVKVSKELKVRGSIKAKYYKLAEDFYSLFDIKKKFFIDIKNFEKSQKDFMDELNLLQFGLKIIENQLISLDQFISFPKENISLNHQLYSREIIDIIKSFKLIFLNEEEFNELRSKLNDFYSAVKSIELKNQKQANRSDKPYLFTISLFNIARLLEF